VLGAVVGEALVDLVGKDGDLLVGGHLDEGAELLLGVDGAGRVAGELMMTILVRGLIASSNWAGVIFQPFSAVVWTTTGSAPARRTISG